MSRHRSDRSTPRDSHSREPPEVLIPEATSRINNE